MDRKKFQKKIWEYYKKNGRHTLPWRKTKNPYRILVSEVMLQQTQVSRVIPKYKSFLKKFPTLESLARAPLQDVLIEWQGLGYNRRAKYLHETAKIVWKEHSCTLPKTHTELQNLPGIGDYTARAICVFAYGQSQTMIETNIRTVIINHFFQKRKDVRDGEVLAVLEKVNDKKKPQEWYWALMDYGTYLKEQKVLTHRNSIYYKKQTPFKGSNREVRGMILRELSKGEALTHQTLQRRSKFDIERIKEQLRALHKEEMVSKKRSGGWSL